MPSLFYVSEPKIRVWKAFLLLGPLGYLGGCYMTWVYINVFLQMQHNYGSNISLPKVTLLCCLGARACIHSRPIAGLGQKNGHQWQFIAETLQTIQIKWNNKALILYTALPQFLSVPLRQLHPITPNTGRQHKSFPFIHTKKWMKCNISLLTSRSSLQHAIFSYSFLFL